MADILPYYTWRQRSYPWAQRVLTAAEAEYGTPGPVAWPSGPGRPGRPRSRPAVPVPAARPAPAPTAPARPCGQCGYLATALGHRIECGNE